jgi:hypothetical protein
MFSYIHESQPIVFSSHEHARKQEVCAALNAVCRLTTVDTIPAVIAEVVNKLKHEARPLILYVHSKYICMDIYTH